MLYAFTIALCLLTSFSEAHDKTVVGATQATAHSTSNDSSVMNQDSDITNAVLIFLDDSETEIDAITGSFLAAFTQEAAPIIVSAHLINTIDSIKTVDKKNGPTILEDFKQLASKNSLNDQEQEQYKSILAYALNFDRETNEKWIIKEVSQYLYLFLPKKYLRSKNIALESVQSFTPQQPITPIERMLSLKVNHLKTVPRTSIQKPAQKQIPARYFIPTLDTIFVTKKEYGNQPAIPSLSLFMHGHGETGFAICQLAPADFGTFLMFLEKLQTRLLIYLSCYAGGANTDFVYKDMAVGAQVMHSFPIVIIALTDAYTFSPVFHLELKNNQIVPYSESNYICFVQAITQPDQIQYSEAVRCLQPKLLEANIPQIRYPGLPWFSILDYDTVASIGAVMAKSRTTPLDVARFFAKQGKLSTPHALLLYARDIPFELIVNTKLPEERHEDGSIKSPEICYIPVVVSMIPGAVVHFIKKISSSCNSALDILANFYIEGLWYRKIFIIDEINAPFSAALRAALGDAGATTGTLTSVLVDVTPRGYTTYFTYNNAVYITHGHEEESDDEIMPVKATDEQIAKYQTLLTKNTKQEVLQRAHAKKPDTLPAEAFATIRAAQERKIASLQPAAPTPVAQAAAVKQAAPHQKGGIRNRRSIKAHKKKVCPRNNASKKRIGRRK